MLNPVKPAELHPPGLVETDSRKFPQVVQFISDFTHFFLFVIL